MDDRNFDREDEDFGYDDDYFRDHVDRDDRDNYDNEGLIWMEDDRDEVV